MLPPKYERTSIADVEASATEWRQLLSDNLDSDLAHWRARGPLRAADVVSLRRQLHRQSLTSVLRLVLVHGNRLYWPDRDDVNGSGPPQPCSPHKEAFHATLSPLLESGRLQLPNVLFLFNSDDNRPRLCAPAQPCSAPLISLIKTVATPGLVDASAVLGAGVSVVGGLGGGGGGAVGINGDGDGDDEDLLVPQMLWMPDALYSVPWRNKEDVAFFRGAPYRSGYWYGRFNCSHMCPRAYLAWRSLEEQQQGVPRTLDVGIVQPYHPSMSYMGIPPSARRPCVPPDLPVAAPVPIPNHSKYKWLLHLEGITASSRLALVAQAMGALRALLEHDRARRG